MTEENENKTYNTIKMKSTLQDRVRHLINDLTSTPMRPKEQGYRPALQYLRTIVETAGLSYVILQRDASDNEYERASTILHSPEYLIMECDRCNKQVKNPVLYHGTMQTESDTSQDEQSTTQSSEQDDEDPDAYAAKVFNKRHQVFGTPNQALMFYFKQLAPLPTWSEYITTKEQPRTWKDLYSIFLEYFFSLQAREHIGLIEALLKYFGLKQNSKLRIKQVRQILTQVEELITSHWKKP